jgi:hypothetical protein
MGFLLFAFVVFLAIIHGNIGDKNKERQNQRFYEIAFAIKSEIDLAYDSADGYSREFWIPQDVSGMSYQVLLSPNMVAVKSLNGDYALALPVKNASGEVILGQNVIRRENGYVFFNS